MNDRSQKITLGFFWVIAIVGLMILHIGSPKVWAENIQQVEGLKRVGPVDPTYGYPSWYEDKSGLKLGLCVDLDFCFMEIPDPTMPLFMPTELNDPNANFPDESFYYAAESIFAGAKKGVRAVLVQALEAMFFSDAGVIPGDQAVMSRIRLRIDNLTEGEEYTVIYPYGRMTFVAEADAGPGAAKGPGLSMTRDIGLIGPLRFEGPLPGDIGPFLIPVGYTGAFMAGDFIGDGGVTEVRVTGSPLGTNFFRIEGKNIGLAYPDFKCTDLTPIGPNTLEPNDCVESFLFAIMGQVAQRLGVRVDRATFSKVKDASNQDQIFVNVWASTFEGQTLVATVDGGPALNMTEGVDGNYFGRLSVPADTIPQTVRVTNTTDNPPFSESLTITDEVMIRDTTYTIGSGLNVTAESSNQADLTSMTAYLIEAQEVRTDGVVTPPSFPLIDQGNGLATGGTTVVTGLEEQPAFKVMVKSGGGGITEAKVAVAGSTTTGGAMGGVLAIAGADLTVTANGQTVILNGSDSLGPLNLSYLWSHDDPSGRITLINPNSSQTSFVTPSEDPPLPGGKLVVNFTLTVSDGVNTDPDTMTVTMIQPASLPVDTCLVTQALYRSDKERWVVEGNCDLAAGQTIEVWLGNEINTKRVLIGKTLVDEVGLWAVDRGNRSATEDGSVPGPDDTRIHVISSRGFEIIRAFTIE